MSAIGLIHPPRILGTLHDCTGPADCTCRRVYVVRESATRERADGYNAVARNERADSRIIDGPGLELIPSGRGRSRTARE